MKVFDGNFTFCMFEWMENREVKWENGVGMGLDRGKDGGWDRMLI